MALELFEFLEQNMIDTFYNKNNPKAICLFPGISNLRFIQKQVSIFFCLLAFLDSFQLSVG